ncbi:hypothetical protein PENNAL_c0142G01185 [Penicillium nalgiovense]|uniref:Uncharacterized protein n=1 Tax=Penicillium nalgiovense TaxID=60175 RepID=A0A1V6X185_PENNA|nr:hypothetical protein PENNAL_c0142G01185 [Penicillium nalgiovense]
MSQYGNIKSNKTDFERVGLPDKKIGGSLGDEANDSMNDVIQPPHLLRPKPTRYVSYLSFNPSYTAPEWRLLVHLERTKRI